MEFLSLNGGMCQRHFFYNRTPFSDSEFLAKMDAMHRKFLTNWAQAVAFHPLHMSRHWAVYKCYLRHWINHYRGAFKGKRLLHR